MSNTAIIIGANGQDGFYLQAILEEKGYEVVGVSRSGDYLHTDLADYAAIEKLIERTQPAYVFHLAANSSTSHAALFDNHVAIGTGSVNILEAVKRVSAHTKVFLSGSGLQFENKGVPIKETDAFAPTSAYAVERIHSVYLARYFRTLGIKVYVGYFFNHESPRRTERHVSQMIASAVKRIVQGSDEKIEIGDMYVKKEWTFAGDIMDAVMCFTQQDKLYEAVLGSGLGYSIREYIELCFQHIGKDWQQYIKQRDNFKAEYSHLISDPSTIHTLGWKPKHDFNDLVTMMLT